jgi:signal recognition particle GTPase
MKRSDYLGDLPNVTIIKFVGKSGKLSKFPAFAAARFVAKITGLSINGAMARLRRYALDADKLYAPAKTQTIKREKLTDLCSDLDARKKAMRGD